MSNRDFEIEMRLQADFSAAQAQLEQTREGIDRITAATAAANAESAGGSAGGTSTAAIEAETAALNGNVTAREAAAAASLATRGAAAGEIALLGELEDRLALGAASFEELAKTEALLDLAMGKHLLTTEEYNAALIALNGTQATLDRTTKGSAVATVAVDAEKNAAALDKFSFASQGAVREYGVLAGELARGNTARLEGSLFTLANRTGILASLFSTTGLAILGLTAALGGLAVAYYKGAEQEDAMNKALILSGNYAGVTRGQMESLAQAVGRTSGSFGDAYAATTKLVASGKITGDVLDNATRAAVSYAQLTGESIDKAVAVMVKIGEDPVRAVKELDGSLHFLTGTQYDQIKAMDKAGDSAGATALAMGLLTKAMDEDIVKAKEQEGTLETLFDRWVKGLSTIKQGLLDIGKDTTLADQLQAAKEDFKQEEISANHFNLSGGVDYLGIDHAKAASEALAKVLAITKQINAENNEASKKAIAIGVDDAYKKATDDLDRLSTSVDKNAEKQAKLNELYRDYEAIQAHDPHDKRLTDGSLETLTADIEKRYEEKKPRGTGVDRAELNADVKATQDALSALNDAYTNSEKVLEAQHKAGLISDAAFFQGQLDNINNLETAEVARLEQEKAQVATHGTNAAQRIAIDQKVASIEAQIAKVQADAAAKRTEIEAQQHQLDLKRTEQLHQVQEEYDNAIGDTLDASLLRLQDDFNKRMAEMVAASNTAGIAIMKKLLPIEVAKAQLDALMTQVDQSFNAESAKQQAIQTQLDQHTITESDARAQIVQLYKDQSAAVEKLLPQMEALAAATGDPRAIAALDQIKQKLLEMSDQTSLLVQKIGDVFEGSFNTALNSLIEHTASLGQAARQFAIDIAKGLGEFATQQLAQLARAKLQSLLGGSSAPEALAISSAAASAAPVLGSGVIAGGTEAAATIAAAFEAAGSAVAAEIAAAMASGGGGGGSGIGSLLSSLFSGGSSAGAGSAISSAASLLGDGFFAEGGLVSGPGTGTSDSILAHLSDGEHVTRAAIVAQPGALAFLSDFNNRGMQALADRDRAFSGADLSKFRAPPQYRFADGGLARAAKSMQPVVKLRLINALDAHEIGRVYAESADGEKTVVNHIARNPNKIKRALGG